MPISIWKPTFGLTSTTVGGQYSGSSALVRTTNGGFLFAGADSPGLVTGESDVRAFGADATPLGAESAFASGSLNGPQEGPSITALVGGGFYAAWADSQGGISGRPMNTSGAPTGAASTIGALATGAMTDVQTAALTGGNVAVVAQSSNTDPLDNTGGIRLIVVNSAGSVVSAVALANTITTGTQSRSTVQALSNGNFVVAWQSADTGDGSGGCIRYRLFDANGAGLGAEAVLNTATSGNQTEPEFTTLTDGRLLAVWHDAGTTALRGRFLTSTGTPSGSDFALPFDNPVPFGTGRMTVEALANGGFLVLTDTNNTITARAFTSTGMPDGASVDLTAGSLNANTAPSAVRLADGRVAISFTSFDGADNNTNGMILDTRGDDFTLPTANTTSHASDQNNIITGTAGADTIYLMAGSDTFTGGAGNDVIFGGAGVDNMFGGADDDTLWFDPADNVIDGGVGLDTARATTNDGLTIRMDAWNVEYLFAGNGNDTIFTFGTAQIGVDGGGGNDSISGNVFGDTLGGNVGNDVLDGKQGNDTLGGGMGSDRLLGAEGADTLFGEGDPDAYVYRGLIDAGDTIIGFEAAAQFGANGDKIEIIRSGFMDPAFWNAGALDPNRFVAGQATLATGQFLFDTGTGRLFWDGDGTGAGVAQLLLTTQGVGTLTAADFILV